jgi:DeoR family transcriptional regulator of aga operon
MTSGAGGTRPRSASAQRARRLTAILDLVARQGSVSLADLTEGLGISPATARRDLTELADSRLVTRTHGGATAAEGRTELPVTLRGTQFAEAKRMIARAMAVRVPAGRHVVALSGGTTTAEVARELGWRGDLTVVTNALPIALLLSERGRVRVVMTGGFLRPESLELVGVLAEHTFSAVNVGTAILGADGVSASAGVTTHDDTEARTNRAMVTAAQQTVVVADGSKVGRVALAQMAGLDQVTTLVTDASADPAELDRIRAAGVDVVVAPAPQGRVDATC